MLITLCIASCWHCGHHWVPLPVVYLLSRSRDAGSKSMDKRVIRYLDLYLLAKRYGFAPYDVTNYPCTRLAIACMISFNLLRFYPLRQATGG